MALRFDPLKPGDRIAVIAPSSPFEREVFDQGIEVIRGLGFVPEFRDDVFARSGYLAGDDERRALEFRQAMARPETAAVFCCRGGYGAMRLLEHLTPGVFEETHKLILGFSDITVLHAALARTGVPSLHSPLVTTLPGEPPASLQALKATLTDPSYRVRFKGEGLIAVRPGVARGRTVGGNLTLLTHLIGTGWFPSLAGKILFLEDTGERPYRIDRMLTHLRLAKAFDGVRGVILGSFAGCDEPSKWPDAPPEIRAIDVLAERLLPLEVPIIAGVQVGHVSPNMPFPLGIDVLLDANRLEVVFEEGLLQQPRA